MLAVFERSVAKPPAELDMSPVWPVPFDRFEAEQLFNAIFPDAVIYNFSNGSFMAISHCMDNTQHPRSAVVDDIYCLFAGSFNNLGELRRHYGLGRSTTEAMLVIEAYKVLRDRAPYPPDQVIKDFSGKFMFVLFDLKNGTIFAARDRDSDLNFAWGKVLDGSLAFSDDHQVILDMCGRSSTFFPAGCFYMNTTGLVSFEQPLHKVKAIRCTMEELCAPGIVFVVDRWYRRPGNIPRVGSESNWSDACNTREDDIEEPLGFGWGE